MRCVCVCVSVGERESKGDQCGLLCLEVNLGEHIHTHKHTDNYYHLEQILGLQILNDVENTLRHTHHNKLQSFLFHSMIRLKAHTVTCNIITAENSVLSLSSQTAPIKITTHIFSTQFIEPTCL